MSDKLEKAVDVIAEKREMPEELKQGVDFSIFKNSISAIICMIILIIINLLFLFASKDIFSIVSKCFAFGVLISVITFFELGYRKDEIKYWIIGIELLVLDILIMYIPYVYVIFNTQAISVIMVFPVIFAIYFVFKSIVIYCKSRKDYLNTISDVKEILQDDELDSYLDEKSTKTLKAKKEKKQKQENEKIEKENNKKAQSQILNKEVKNKSQKQQVKKETKQVKKGGK